MRSSRFTEEQIGTPLESYVHRESRSELDVLAPPFESKRELNVPALTIPLS